VIRVLLADDQALVRAGFRMLVSSSPDMEIVGEAGDGEEAVRQVRSVQPEVVLMDIRMPNVDGLEATRRISAEPDLIGTRVLILTTFQLDEYVFDALRAGASGFLLKDCEPTELLQAIRIIASGDALLAPSVTRTLIAAFAAQPRRSAAKPAALAELTEREREVVARRRSAPGRSNEELNDRLVGAPTSPLACRRVAWSHWMNAISLEKNSDRRVRQVVEISGRRLPIICSEGGCIQRRPQDQPGQMVSGK
jgi:DNA-binding NarL/FixJ family response regulator